MNKQAYPRLLLNFNPHSRKGSDCRNDSSVVLTPFYFNPHSRKGSDQRLMSANYRERISIHTPARGVTAIARGPGPSTIYFNPHSRKGSDIYTLFKTYLLLPISIHTPARGVTKFLEEREAGLSISIHTPARGVTETCPQGSRCAGNFNPHSRKGSDIVSLFRCSERYYFNPHSRKGSDCIQSDRHQNHYRISIHTPARGVTIFKIHCMDRIGISIHTPARGVTSLFTA